MISARRMQDFSALRLSSNFSAIQVTTAALKTLIALIPVSMLLFGSLLLFFKSKTAPSFLQLLGAVCFLVVVFIRIFEAFRVFPYMNWGRDNSIGHYVDFWSAVLGLVLFPVGYLLRSLTMCRF